MAALDTPTDALTLLAYKIAPRQFDISYRFANISLRDQIVRAQSLVRTLLDAGLVAADVAAADDEVQLLICGAGAAGLAAAREAQAAGISFLLIEKDGKAPGGVLHSTALRYVSTAMYEWPHPNHGDHSFPLARPALLGGEMPSTPSLPLAFDAPVTIGRFAAIIDALVQPDLHAWAANFKDFAAGTAPSARRLFSAGTTLHARTKDALKALLDGKTSIHGVPLHDAPLPVLALQRSTPPSTVSIRARYVIYAVGFAPEVVEFARGKPAYAGFQHSPFWEADTIPAEHLGVPAKRPSVTILGSGDGALQDTLRCLVRSDVPHPLAVWDRLMAHAQGGKHRLRHSRHVQDALARVAAADGYTTAGAVWTHHPHVFKSLDLTFVEIIEALMAQEGPKLRAAVGAILRPDVAHIRLITRDGHFTKAYALNRFLVLLFQRVLAGPEAVPGPAITFEILSGEVIAFTRPGQNRRGANIRLRLAHGTTAEWTCDLALLRAGLDRDLAPTQLVGLSGMDTGRAELGRIPPPIRPVDMP